MNWSAIEQLLQAKLASVGLQVIGAIVLYIVGRWLISFVIEAFQRVLRRQHIEPTILRFAANTISVILNITLVIAILGYFGVQTTTFAALIAAAGLAVGTAWAGLLANFAAGAFILVLRPFKVGDAISAGGVTGTVEEIGLFSTTFDTSDNVRTYVGNNKIFSDTIQNFTVNPYRRVELTVQLSASADPRVAIQRLRERIEAVPNVLKNPEPEIAIASFSTFGPILSVRPCCHHNNHSQVTSDCNMAIHEAMGTFPNVGYPLILHQAQAASASGR